MKVKNLPPEVRHIWHVAKVVQGVMGFTMGLYLFTCGPLYYEKLAQVSTPELAMTFTTLIYGVNVAFIAFLEIPTGAIGDAIGRKWTVVWSFVAYMLFYITLSFIPISNSLWLILTLAFVGRIIASFAYTFFSGTFTAWCVDHLREKAPEIGYEHLLSKAYTYRLLAMMFGGALGVTLYLWHWADIGFLIAAIACLACVSFCLVEMDEEKNVQFLDRKTLSVSSVIKRMGEIVAVGLDVFRRSHAILALVFIYASYAFVINTVDYLWPVYLRSKVDLGKQMYYWVGLVVVIQLLSALGSYGLTLRTRRWQKNNGTKTHNNVLRRWIVGSCLFSALPILLLSWLTANHLDTFPLFCLAILPVEFACGIFDPCFETLMNNHIPDHHASERATIMSLGSMVRGVLVMLLIIPSGGSSGATTTIGWAIPAVVLLVTVLIGNSVLKRSQKTVPEIKIFGKEPSTDKTAAGG